MTGVTQQVLEQPVMSTEKGSEANARLTLQRSLLYPPLNATVPEVVYVGVVANGDRVTHLDVRLNAQPVADNLIRLNAGSAGGLLYVMPGFHHHYTGEWPAIVDIRLWRDHVMLDKAYIRLLDTRRMEVHRIHCGPSYDPVPIPSTGLDPVDVSVQVSAFDSNDVLLPEGEFNWEITLPGPVAVLVKAAPGLEQQLTISLVAPEEHAKHRT
jgi:hypothetical protein